jgi:hypothetical protein
MYFFGVENNMMAYIIIWNMELLFFVLTFLLWRAESDFFLPIYQISVSFTGSKSDDKVEVKLEIEFNNFSISVKI